MRKTSKKLERKLGIGQVERGVWKKESNKWCYVLIVIFLVLLLILVYLPSGLEKQAEINCIKLQQQEVDYPLFWSTELEKKTCKEFGIILTK